MRILLLWQILIFNLVATAQITTALDAFGPELERFGYMTSANTAALENVLSNDLIYIHSNAFSEDKASHLKNIESGKIRYNSMDLEQTEYFKKSGFCFTNGIVHVRGSFDSKEFDIRLRYTAVYQKQKCTWKLLRWQSTKLP